MSLFRRERGPEKIEIAGAPIEIRRSARARRMRLTIDPRDGAVRLALPKRASIQTARRWVEEQRGWIAAQLDKLPVAQPIQPGSAIPFMGETLWIEMAEDRRRGVAREGGRLIVAGPAEMVGHRVTRWLREQALATLEAETRRFAEIAGVSIGKVGVGDPRARWGSCSSTGDIRYSWRLILAPPPVREATVAHEVAHRLHMDHSSAFHGAVERLLGRSPDVERRWLRTHGTALHRIGRN